MHGPFSNRCHASSNKDATRNKCIASSNKCLTSSNKKLVVTGATLVVTKFAIRIIELLFAIPTDPPWVRRQKCNKPQPSPNLFNLSVWSCAVDDNLGIVRSSTTYWSLCWTTAWHVCRLAWPNQQAVRHENMQHKYCGRVSNPFNMTSRAGQAEESDLLHDAGLIGQRNTSGLQE